jgi:hypothetical protein
MSKLFGLLAITLIGGTGVGMIASADLDAEAQTRYAEAFKISLALQSKPEAPAMGAIPIHNSMGADVAARATAPKIVLVASPQRLTLIRDIQQQLKRVGCHAGEVGTIWDHDAKDSMQRFMQSVNATLPITQPDHILLTLLQGHKAMACGAPCPDSEMAIGNGHCQVYATALEAIDTPPLARALNAISIEGAAVATTAAAPLAKASAASLLAHGDGQPAFQLLSSLARPSASIVAGHDESEVSTSARRAAKARTNLAKEGQNAIAALGNPNGINPPARIGAAIKPAPRLAPLQRILVATRPMQIAPIFGTRALNARLVLTER